MLQWQLVLVTIIFHKHRWCFAHSVHPLVSSCNNGKLVRSQVGGMKGGWFGMSNNTP